MLKDATIRCVLLTVFITSCIHSVLSNVTISAPGDAVAGRPFTLECKITRSTSDRDYHIWDRNVGQTTFRIYASRECTPSIPVSPSSPAGLSGGCQHVNGEEVYTVTIENVTEDAGRGRWICRYRALSDSVTLDVKVMVTQVTLTNPPDAVLAGDPKTFTCVTSASKPQACIRWCIRSSGNIRELDPPADCNQDSSSVQTTTRTLTLTARAEEDGAELYCNASNSVTDPPVRSEFHTLNVHYPPQSDMLLSGYVNNTAVESGETLTLTCQVGKGNPRPALSWSSECGLANPVLVNDGSHQINISITVSPSLNQKTCVCKGDQDGALTGWTEEKSRRFSVTFGPDRVQLQAQSEQSGNTVTVTENSTVTFTCTSGESNPPAVLSWYNNSSPIAAAELSEVSSQRGPSHGYLTTQRYTVRADRYHDGVVISCEAERPGNGGSKRVSHNLTLNVAYGPLFTSCPSSYIFVEYAPAELSCTIWANPEPRINWSRGAQPRRSVTNHRYTSVVRFDKISRTDSGVYTVTASNNVTRGVERTVNVTVYFTAACDSLDAPLAGGISGGIVLLGVALAGVVILLRRRREKRSSGEKEVPPNHQEMAENPSMAARVYQTLNLSPSSPEAPVYVNEAPIPEYENTSITTTENDPTDPAYKRLRTNAAPKFDTYRLYENTKLS